MGKPKKEIDKYSKKLGSKSMFTHDTVIHIDKNMVRNIEQTYCGINELGDAIINEYKAVEK